jgi:type III restriction enzyme
MDLFPFQETASTQIAERFGQYVVDPLMIDRTRTIPFFQLLVSITGSGKTLILADTISQMRNQIPREPVVLWLSKVCWQYSGLQCKAAARPCSREY